MALRYRVAKIFAHNGRTYTNSPADLKHIKRLGRNTRDHHIERGNLIEWDDRKAEAPPAATTTTETEES